MNVNHPSKTKEHNPNENPTTMLNLINKLESENIYYNFIRHPAIITS